MPVNVTFAAPVSSLCADAVISIGLYPLICKPVASSTAQAGSHRGMRE